MQQKWEHGGMWRPYQDLEPQREQGISGKTSPWALSILQASLLCFSDFNSFSEAMTSLKETKNSSCLCFYLSLHLDREGIA